MIKIGILPSRSSLINNLEIFDKCIKKIGIFYWLSEGTALGAIREQDVIDNDSDIDIGIYYRDRDVFMSKVVPLLYKHGFKIVRHDQLTFYRNGSTLDIDFTGVGKPCRAYKWPVLCDYHINTIKPYRIGYINNKKYIVPSQDYIKKLYGEKWYIKQNVKPKDITI